MRKAFHSEQLVEKSLALDREDTLKKADKLLRQGRLDAAIAEYVRVVEDQPRDWTAANTLGDLYVRANQPDKAVAQYSRIANHFFEDGFYPKAAALYKKVLKIVPEDEQSQLQLADLSARQGLLSDAKSYFQTIAARRRARGDQRGADEIVARLGTIDPADIDARIAGARVLAKNGDEKSAATRFRDLYADLTDKGRDADALKALEEAVRLNPRDLEGRGVLAKAAIASGDIQAARGHLDLETAGQEPSLLMALAAIELRAGELDRARAILPKLLALSPAAGHDLIELAWTLLESSEDAAFAAVTAVADALRAAKQFDDAAATLQEFSARRPAYVPALLKLIEVCVDGGLETTMYDAQAQLADAYLSAGQGADARAIAEDLVAREPWEGAHIERFRRALVMMRVSEPDTVIAERLSGETPFTATDHFPPPPSPEPDPVPAPPVAAKLPASAPPQSAAKPAKKKPGHGEIDLTSALGDLHSAESEAVAAPAPAPTLDDVFKGLRKGATREPTRDQAAQHMKLARTYIEMDLLEEAASALKNAARSPRHRFEAASVLGRLYKQHGDVPQAIEWLERAAEAPPPGPEEGRALLYDLGVALEETGETSRALAVFLELQSEGDEYRDVAERAERLARVQTGG